ncbi:S1 family peptidase [Flavobacterium sp.]|uniref:S1 family peptidase n=1 Tax=Flavobacterium sp. TaxID=239 RepID=UPI004034E005
MTTKEVWTHARNSVCQIIHRDINNKVISVGTGFKIKNYIITNNHVYNPLQSHAILIQFKDDDGKTIKIEKQYSKEEFISTLEYGMPQDSWDFALLKDNYFEEIDCLELSTDSDFEIGGDCCFLGYPLSSNFLSIHNAIISACYTNVRNNVRYIQLDASVNRGNSGGPLLEKETGKVIGIITLKNTGFSEKYKELKQSYSNNIKQIEQAQKTVSMNLGGIDTLETFKIIQRQMDAFGNELERSSNVGIAYAFQLDEILKHI